LWGLKEKLAVMSSGNHLATRNSQSGVHGDVPRELPQEKDLKPVEKNSQEVENFEGK